jgi:uncharacterized protein YbaR (Trm112 family)
MAVNGKLLEILCCPVTKVPVTPLSKDNLAKLNDAVNHGEVQYVDGRKVDAPLEEALITENGKTIYPVRSGIPVMLQDEGIATDQVPGLSVKK